jgi:hypothetical protein
MPGIKIGPVRSLVSRIGAQIMSRPRGKKPLRPGPGVSLQSVATGERSECDGRATDPADVARKLDTLVNLLVDDEGRGKKRSDRAELLSLIWQTIDRDLGQALFGTDEQRSRSILRDAARGAIRNREPAQLQMLCKLVIELYRVAKSTDASPDLLMHRKRVLQPLFNACMRRLNPEERPLTRIDRDREQLLPELASAAPPVPANAHAVPALPIDQDSKPSTQASWQKTPSPRAVTRQTVADLAAGLVDAIVNRRFEQALQRLFDLDQLDDVFYRDIAAAVSQFADRKGAHRNRNIREFVGLIDALIIFKSTIDGMSAGGKPVDHMLTTWDHLKRNVWPKVKAAPPSNEDVENAKQMIERLAPAQAGSAPPAHDLPTRRLLTVNNRRTKPGELVFRPKAEATPPKSG